MRAPTFKGHFVFKDLQRFGCSTSEEGGPKLYLAPPPPPKQSALSPKRRLLEIWLWTLQVFVTSRLQVQMWGFKLGIWVPA